MKKLLAVILCLTMLFTLAAPAFASGEDPATRPYEDSQFFTYGDYKIHYRVWAAEEARGQIFMIHGFALSSYCFTPLAAKLVEAGYTCVLADLPDFGYSSRETAETEKLPREEIMHALMKELSPDPWYVAGHSMGGYIALAVAQKYPEDVKNLLLYGTAGNEKDPASLTFVMNNPAFIRVMGTVLETAAHCTGLVRLLLIAALGDLPYAMSYNISEITNPYRIKGTGAGALYSFSMLPDTDFEAVKNMPPILYINGSRDNVIPAADRDKFRTVLPAGSVDYVVDGGAHLFIENLAEETADVTLAFLANN